MRGSKVAWVVRKTPHGTHVRLSTPVATHLREYLLPGPQSDLVWLERERLAPYDPENERHGSHFLGTYGDLETMLRVLGYELVDKEPQPESWIGEWLEERLVVA